LQLEGIEDTWLKEVFNVSVLLIVMNLVIFICQMNYILDSFNSIKISFAKIFNARLLAIWPIFNLIVQLIEIFGGTVVLHFIKSFLAVFSCVCFKSTSNHKFLNCRIRRVCFFTVNSIQMI